jgi:hypothetical protein
VPRPILGVEFRKGLLWAVGLQIFGGLDRHRLGLIGRRLTGGAGRWWQQQSYAEQEQGSKRFMSWSLGAGWVTRGLGSQTLKVHLVRTRAGVSESSNPPTAISVPIPAKAET